MPPSWGLSDHERRDSHDDADRRQRILIVLNDPPYGSERTWNGLRLADSLAKEEDVELRVFLVGDAVASAKAGQKTPQGYYNVANMVMVATRQGAEVGLCGTCMDSRGLTPDQIVEGTRRSSLAELTSWTKWADKLIAF